MDYMVMKGLDSYLIGNLSELGNERQEELGREALHWQSIVAGETSFEAQ